MNGRHLALGLAVVALASILVRVPGIYYVNVASQILLYAIFALGVSVLVGYAGLVSLGHAGLFGLAAYGVALPARRRPWPCSSGDRHLGDHDRQHRHFRRAVFRATGIGFIMITLALGEILWGLAYRWISITNGDNGISVASRPSPFGFSLSSAVGFYYATLIIFLLAIAAVFTFVRSPLGAALMRHARPAAKNECARLSRLDDPLLGLPVLRAAPRRSPASFSSITISLSVHRPWR